MPARRWYRAPPSGFRRAIRLARGGRVRTGHSFRSSQGPDILVVVVYWKRHEDNTLLLRIFYRIRYSGLNRYKLF